MHEKRGKAGRPFHNNEELGSDAMGGYSLEDYIYSLESRGERGTNNNIHSDPDVYGQLQQKERDLILAAELGKALLEKNEDLSKQNEKIAEDFSQKLEVFFFNYKTRNNEVNYPTIISYKFWVNSSPICQTVSDKPAARLSK